MTTLFIGIIALALLPAALVTLNSLLGALSKYFGEVMIFAFFFSIAVYVYLTPTL